GRCCRSRREQRCIGQYIAVPCEPWLQAGAKVPPRATATRSLGRNERELPRRAVALAFVVAAPIALRRERSLDSPRDNGRGLRGTIHSILDTHLVARKTICR